MVEGWFVTPKGEGSSPFSPVRYRGLDSSIGRALV
jgi:hypothetical protein